MTDNYLVLDASVALKAILPNPIQKHCQALIKTLVDIQPVAPALWAHETTSVIAKSVHFGQITEVEGRHALELIQELGVQLFLPEAASNKAAFEWAVRMKRASAYDCYYLVLAQDLECDFWTADHRLYNGLKNENLKWLKWIEDIKAIE